MRSFVKALLLMGVAMPAGADTALVVGTVDANATTSYGAPRYLGTAFTPLDQAGFSLLSAIDADAATLQGLLTALVTAEEQDTLVIALAGRFAHFDGWTWFLGRDAGQPDLGTVSAKEENSVKFYKEGDKIKANSHCNLESINVSGMDKFEAS